MSAAETDAVVETIVRAEVMQQFVDQTSSIVHETVMHIGSDGISTRVVDSANVAMIDIQIDAVACESVPSGSFVAGVDLGKLDDYLSGASGDDPVSFAFDPETRRLNLRHTNREFNVAMIDPDAMRNEPDIPDLEFTTDVTLPADELKGAVDTAGLVTDHVVIESDAEAGAVEVIGEGDIDDVTITFEGDDLGEGSSVDSDTKAMYSIGYLNGDGEDNIGGFLKPMPKTDLRVRFADEMPSKYNYEFADGHGQVEIMLAPRIQSK